MWVLSAAVPVAARSPGTQPSLKPVVRVWLKGGERREPGDRVRVYFKSEHDGYALVLHAEPDGRVRVLFPLDPTEDNHVRGGKTYEVRSRGDRDAFTAHDSGTGTVYLAVSTEPFHVDSVVRGGHWDYGSSAFQVGNDPEADLTELARQLAGASQFDYDLIRYDVSNVFAYRRYPRYFDPWGWAWYPWGSRFAIGFGWPGYYRGWWGVPWRRIW
jgi:hypothetical protein